LFLARTTPDGTGRVRRIGSRQGKMGRSLLRPCPRRPSASDHGGRRRPASVGRSARTVLAGSQGPGCSALSAGMLLLNLGRMAAVALVATRGGFVPAVVFHDYGGTALIVLWLFAFSYAATRWILGER